MASNYPVGFTNLNDLSTKQLNVVVVIEDSPVSFSLVPTFKRLRYGDAGLYYGKPGLVYGGLVEIDNVKPILSTNSNLTISQKIEPEQGRASAATLSLEFVDLNGFMTNFITPGQQLDEVLGGKQVKIYAGYANSSFKEDYFVVFRGYITMTTWSPTKVLLQLTDANIKRKQQVFFTGKTSVSYRNLNFLASAFDDPSDTVNINNHGYGLNNVIQLFTDGSLPVGLSTGTNYYVVNPTTNSFQLSSTPSGVAINFVGTGSGNNTISLIETGIDATTIYVDKTDGFIQPITGPSGSYDSSLICYAKIGDEFCSYGPTGLSTNHIALTRAQRGTTAISHKPGDEVDAYFALNGNMIDLALKVMLSGSGVWTTGNSIMAVNNTLDPVLGIQPNCFVLPDGINAVDDYGLAVGDYFYVTGTLSNDGTYTIASFADAKGYPNKLVIVNEPTVLEATTSGTWSSRSQYDVYPVAVGSALRPVDVDVAGWIDVRDTFVFQADCVFDILINQPESGKDWIEQNLLLPAGLYGITRFGRISVSATKPPLAGDGLVVLDNTNVINPQGMTVTRGLNNRRFFNEVQYKYDYDNGGNERNVVSILDTVSLNKFDTSSVLPISGLGLRTSLGADTFIQRRGQYILKRYTNAAYEIQLECNFMAAATIEVSDVAAIYDDGNLQIINYATGQRNLGEQLFEVIQRSLDLRTGQGKLTLLSQIGYQVSDRFAGIAPSSYIRGDATTTTIPVKPSFGAKFLNQEWQKYENIVGNQLRIHSEDYSYDHTVELLGFDPIDKNILLIGPALPTAPLEDYIVDLAVYDDTSSSVNSKSKLLYSFIDPVATVVSGSSTTQFDLSPSDAALLTPGFPVIIHNTDYSLLSSESIVDSVVGTTVTLKTAIEFIPSAGQLVELIGFKDGSQSGPYRVL